MPLVSILLALLLVLTGQELAIARGHAAASGSAVLCGGQGLILVTLDDRGQPVGPPHYCPDAVATIWAPPAAIAPTPPARLLRAIGSPQIAVLVLPPVALLVAQARAPPAPV